jgi:hypothetical protein
MLFSLGEITSQGRRRLGKFNLQLSTAASHIYKQHNNASFKAKHTYSLS